MQSLVPNIFVNDISATIAFYQKLGFQIITTVPETGDYVWVMMTCEKVTVMFQTYDSLKDELPEISREQNSGPLLLYIQVQNIRTFYEEVSKFAKVLKGLEKTFYGATEFTIQDNNGIILTFAEDE